MADEGDVAARKAARSAVKGLPAPLRDIVRSTGISDSDLEAYVCSVIAGLPGFIKFFSYDTFGAPAMSSGVQMPLAEDAQAADRRLDRELQPAVAALKRAVARLRSFLGTSEDQVSDADT